jgi:hypothetical protein
MNSIIDCPPLYNYCAATAGALGLMRALRTQMPALNATVNLIAPWMTGKPQFFKNSPEVEPAIALLHAGLACLHTPGRASFSMGSSDTAHMLKRVDSWFVRSGQPEILDDA